MRHGPGSHAPEDGAPPSCSPDSMHSQEPSGFEAGTDFRMGSYSFNLLGAVREAASRLEGEFTYMEVCRLIKEEHPEFCGGDSQVVKAYLIKLAREGRLVRVKPPDVRGRAPGVYRNAGGEYPVLERLERNSPDALTTVKDESS